MAILRKMPLEERILAIRTECEAEIHARVVAERERSDFSTPETMVYRLITDGIGDPILAFEFIRKQEQEQARRENAA